VKRGNQRAEEASPINAITCFCRGYGIFSEDNRVVVGQRALLQSMLSGRRLVFAVNDERDRSMLIEARHSSFELIQEW
jgi:hypothetical protein